MKCCSVCKTEKPDTDFNKKSSNKDGLERYCKDCHRLKNRQHYNNNKSSYKAQSEKYRKELNAWYEELKQSLKCVVCGETKYWRLSFHHTDPSTKEYDVSQMVVARKSRESIISEIEKCICVCHNCHSDIHYELRNRSVV